MLFSKATLLGLFAAAVSATNTFETWSGTSCNNGDHLFFSAGGGVNCQSLGNVRSLRVTNLNAGCSFTYYSDSNCSNDAFLANVGDCDGYADGGPVRSFSIDC